MTRRIVVCADGTWNRLEEDVELDVPTNVLRLTRAIAPFDQDVDSQQVFYDWGVGPYHARVSGGVTGRGTDRDSLSALQEAGSNGCTERRGLPYVPCAACPRDRRDRCGF